jgi:hypothetical protein
MIRFINESYLTTFAVVFRIFPGRTRGYRAGAAIGAITLIEMLVVFGILMCADIHVGRRLLNSGNKWIFLSVVALLYFLNLYVLFLRGHGISFEREFDRLKKSKRVALVLCCVMAAAVAISFFVCSAVAHDRFISGKSAF